MKTIIIYIAVILSILFTSCCSIDREDYPNDSCYVAVVCACRNKKNPSMCKETWTGCNSANTEKRKETRNDYCFKNYKKYEYSSQRECRLTLNQK
jgi:hypothetical protein